MIFVVCQLVEKSWQHKSKSFFTFVDLKKAYDSVPRKGMWLALKKLGVPEKTVNLIEAFHSNMKAKIRVDGELLEDIGVENGLRQCCCMAPVLFSLYTTLVIERWQDRVAGKCTKPACCLSFHTALNVGHYSRDMYSTRDVSDFRIVLGISNNVQWTSCIISDQLRQKWGHMGLSQRRLQNDGSSG